MHSIGPSQPSEWVLIIFPVNIYATHLPLLCFYSYGEALLFTNVMKEQDRRRDLNGDSQGRFHTSEVHALTPTNICHRSLDSYCSTEFGNCKWRVVEIGRWGGNSWAFEGFVETFNTTAAEEEEVVSVGGVVHKSRVRCFCGPEMTRPELERICRVACCIGN